MKSIITECFKQGYKTRDLKTVVLDTLSPFFNDISVLEKCWTDPEVLLAFEYIVRYQRDEVFISGIMDVLHFYRSVYSQYPSEIMDIMTCSFFDPLKRETILWNKRDGKPSFGSNELDEIVVKAMAHIGDILEVGVKPIATELWAGSKLLSNGQVVFSEIQDYQFGKIVHNLLEAHRFEYIF